MSKKQTWIADPALESRMGRNAYRLLCVMVDHARDKQRLFLKPGVSYEQKPWMSRPQMAGALCRFKDLIKLTHGQRYDWATKRLRYLEKGGAGGGWIKCERRNRPGNPEGALRYYIPLRLLKGVAVRARRAGTRLINNISSPSSFLKPMVGTETPEVPALLARAFKQTGSFSAAFVAWKRAGMTWSLG